MTAESRMGCVCVCVRARQHINSNHAQTARFNIPTSYHYCKLLVLCSALKGATHTGSGSPYVQGAANTLQLLTLQPSHNATRHTLHAMCPTSPHRPFPCVLVKDVGGRGSGAEKPTSTPGWERMALDGRKTFSGHVTKPKCMFVCVCDCVTPKSFKSISNCEAQLLGPTAKRLNHVFSCSGAPSAGF